VSDDVAALNSVPTEEELNQLQLTTLQYYLHEANPANGLIRDKTDPSAPCSIDQGPVALMIENYRTGLIWEIMRRCPYVKVGLRRAGFRGSWL